MVQMPLWVTGPHYLAPQGAQVFGANTPGDVTWWDGVTMVDVPDSTTTEQSDEHQPPPPAHQP
jgi:hypothetical protein